MWPSVLAAAVGAALGDAFNYWLGRRYLEQWSAHRRMARFRHSMARTRAFFQRRGVLALVVARRPCRYRASRCGRRSRACCGRCCTSCRASPSARRCSSPPRSRPGWRCCSSPSSCWPPGCSGWPACSRASSATTPSATCTACWPGRRGTGDWACCRAGWPTRAIPKRRRCCSSR
ncbi:MAG: DedA family protein [Algiphilus sp.]